jgi:hypothetical protein
MSQDKSSDDMGNIVENFFKQGETWWKDWLRNNYQVAVALTDLIFKIGSEVARQQAQSWLWKEYRQSKG